MNTSIEAAHDAFGPVNVHGGIAVVLIGFVGGCRQLLHGVSGAMAHRAEGATARPCQLDEPRTVLEVFAHHLADAIRPIGFTTTAEAMAANSMT